MIAYLALFLLLIASFGLLYYYYTLTHTFWNEKLQRYMPRATLLESIKLILKKDENRAFYAHRLTQKYGPLFHSWFLKIVNIADASAVKKVLLQSNKFPRMSNQSDFSKNILFERFMGRNVAMIDGQLWKKQRMLLNPAFTNNSIFLDVFVEKSKYCIEKMILEGRREQNGQVSVPIKDYMTKLTLDILGKAVFGVEFGYLDGKNSDLLDAYQFAFVKGTGNPLYFLFPWLLKLPTAFNRKLIHSLDIMDKEIYNLIHQKREVIQLIISQIEKEANGTITEEEILSKMKTKSLLDLMVLANILHKSTKETDEEFAAMTDKELKDNTVILFVAGHETTASALGFALHAIASKETVQSSICLELEANALLSIHDFENLTYLNTVIKETMRYYPVVQSIPSRIAAEDEELCGYKVPKGSMLMCNTYSLHFSEELWESPFEFRPERFMEEKNIKAASWLPFGMGSHLCLGKGFSLLEQAVFLALLLKEYEISVREELRVSPEFLFSPEPYALYLKKK